MATFPPLPQLNGDIILEVFTHPSLRSSTDGGHNERYTDLGAVALQAAVTTYLFKQETVLTAPEIVQQRAQILTESNIEEWAAHYSLRDRLRYAPEAVQMIMKPAEACKLFYAYVGGVYISRGPQAVNDWIDRLLNPVAAPKEEEASNALEQDPPAQDTKLQPPQPELTALKLPPGIYSQLFQTTAAQRRAKIEFTTESSGPPHAPSWTIRAKVDGAEKGVGSASTKQAAKEEASKRACHSMGWTV